MIIYLSFCSPPAPLKCSAMCDFNPSQLQLTSLARLCAQASRFLYPYADALNYCLLNVLIHIVCDVLYCKRKIIIIIINLYLRLLAVSARRVDFADCWLYPCSGVIIYLTECFGNQCVDGFGVFENDKLYDYDFHIWWRTVSEGDGLNRLKDLCISSLAIWYMVAF